MEQIPKIRKSYILTVEQKSFCNLAETYYVWVMEVADFTKPKSKLKKNFTDGGSHMFISRVFWGIADTDSAILDPAFCFFVILTLIRNQRPQKLPGSKFQLNCKKPSYFSHIFRNLLHCEYVRFGNSVNNSHRVQGSSEYCNIC